MTHDLFDGSKKKKLNSKEKVVDLEKETEKNDESGQSGGALKCLICLEVAVKPHNARCGHVCCFACWDSWLERKLECPLCKSRVRKNQLSPIFSN
jgi:hypothetical protein